MNKYYDKNDRFNSNSRIFEAYFTEVKSKPSILEKISEFLVAIFLALTSARAHRIMKAVVTVACFIGVVGVIGAIERGSLSFGLGLMISFALIAIEFLTFKKRSKHQ